MRLKQFKQLFDKMLDLNDNTEYQELPTDVEMEYGRKVYVAMNQRLHGMQMTVKFQIEKFELSKDGRDIILKVREFPMPARFEEVK